MLKSIWAVVAGLIIVAVLSTLTDTILEKLGVFPPIGQTGGFVDWMALTAIIYRTIYTILGGYVTAVWAPSNPMRHVWVLGFIGLAVSIIGIAVSWGKNLGPEWYPIALAVLALPSVWLGGKLRVRS